MTQPIHRWVILGVSRFTPAPGAPSYISAINWTLHTTVGEVSAGRTSFTTFGPDHPGAADLNQDELIALIRDPQIEAELEAELGHAPLPEVLATPTEEPIPAPEPEAQTTEIPVVEEPVSSTDTPTPAPPAPKRKRARTKKGTYKGDDPATPENEAWTTQ